MMKEAGLIHRRGEKSKLVGSYRKQNENQKHAASRDTQHGGGNTPELRVYSSGGSFSCLSNAPPSKKYKPLSYK